MYVNKRIYTHIHLPFYIHAILICLSVSVLGKLKTPDHFVSKCQVACACKFTSVGGEYKIITRKANICIVSAWFARHIELRQVAEWHTQGLGARAIALLSQAPERASATAYCVRFSSHTVGSPWHQLDSSSKSLVRSVCMCYCFAYAVMRNAVRDINCFLCLLEWH
jgi:hypothetical protein